MQGWVEQYNGLTKNLDSAHQLGVVAELRLPYSTLYLVFLCKVIAQLTGIHLCYVRQPQSSLSAGGTAEQRARSVPRFESCRLLRVNPTGLDAKIAAMDAK